MRTALTRAAVLICAVLVFAGLGAAQQCPQGFTLTGGVCVANGTSAGTVTSVICGTGMTGGTITATGTCNVAATLPSTTSVNSTAIPASATLTQTIASGTVALGTSAIASAACATVVTVSATGVATTDRIQATFNADPTSTTGFIPAVSGSLTIFATPTANNVNFKVCNYTGSSITPGAVTLNWAVDR